MLCSYPQCYAVCSTGPCLWAIMKPCHITVGFGILQALIGTRKNEFSSHDLSRIYSLGKAMTPLPTCKERFHLFVITEKLFPQWTNFLSNSTIYYLIAIIYSDRITLQNMTFFSPPFLISLLMIRQYEFFLITEHEMRSVRWTWPL